MATAPLAPTILIVEDDPALRTLLMRLLREEGFQPLSAGHGAEMARVLETNTVDLILLDVMLPGSNGFDLCRSIRRESDVPIVMLSARDDETDRLIGLELGADDYIGKPFSKKELIARIREHFGKPNEIARHMAETTCEACNSYNMLKLTRRLWSWAPQGSLFDYYERAQLNHIMAHQRPSDGMFVYFMPMAAGGRRSYSTPEDSFWCCVGSGMESHAKHADSIWWRGGDTLYLNLFIPSRLDLPDGDFAIDLDTRYPTEGLVRLDVVRAPAGEREIAVRLPAWCAAPLVKVNGTPTGRPGRDGYARLRRRWKAGDRVELVLPMALRAEPTPDDLNLVAFVSGPLVLAADLGPAERPFERAAPALLGDGPAATLLRKTGPGPHAYAADLAQGGTATFSPFYAQYDRRTAVYAPVFTKARWAAEGKSFLATEQARIDAVARTVDAVYLGEQQPEVDHRVTAANGEIIQLNGRSGRKLGPGGWLEMTLNRRPGRMSLQLVHWGQDAGQAVKVLVDGAVVGVIETPTDKRDGFFAVDLPLPSGAGPARVRLEAGDKAAVFYEARVMAG